jgi:hypothetical protein
VANNICHALLPATALAAALKEVASLHRLLRGAPLRDTSRRKTLVALPCRRCWSFAISTPASFRRKCCCGCNLVGRRRLIVSKHELKAGLISALEPKT